MGYVIAIFGLGCIVTLVVLTGIVQARDFARVELERQKNAGTEANQGKV